MYMYQSTVYLMWEAILAVDLVTLNELGVVCLISNAGHPLGLA
jgi:hypothetical protein